MARPARRVLMQPEPAKRRTQLTLFVSAPHGATLDSLRRVLDPTQAGLIAAHVTLCREDEIDGLDVELIFERVRAWRAGLLEMRFGAPQRFHGHGVLLPCRAGAEQFLALRRALLATPDLRAPEAHLTLAHPRNPRAPGNTDEGLRACPHDLHVVFPAVSLIEQVGSGPWRTLCTGDLGGTSTVSGEGPR